MKITRVSTHHLRSPFTYGAGAGGVGGNLHLGGSMDTLLVKIETDTGPHGWGEGFGFNLVSTTKHAVDRLITPLCVGEDPRDIPALMLKLSRRLHNFGRNGAVSFGLSAIDIALWDIAGRIAGKPLHALLGSAGRKRVPAYASLLRYGDAASVGRNAEAAIARGYRHIKLHEIALDCIGAARAAIPADVPLMLDINCAWGSVEEAIAFGKAVAAPNTRWVEEPTWPPESFGNIARVRASGHTAIAAGENAGSVEDFRTMFAAGAVDYAQPSVTKIGGVSAMMEIAALAKQAGVAFMPHCPYFGAGLLATLHILAAHEVETPIEVYFADLALAPYGSALDVRDGFMRVPDGPGLGLEPDAAALAAAV